MNKSRWLQLMDDLGFSDNLDAYQKLRHHYSESHRHYHNTRHIDAVLTHLEATRHLAEDYNALALALWFHDAIYKIGSTTNEKDSADWATAFLEQNNAPAELVTTVYALIMVTLHDALPKKNDEQLMVDIDLSILGSSAEIYAQFEVNIRKEYKRVPAFIFKRKRKEILQGFLDRQRIYSHDHFYGLLEAQARANLKEHVQ